MALCTETLKLIVQRDTPGLIIAYYVYWNAQCDNANTQYAFYQNNAAEH